MSTAVARVLDGIGLGQPLGLLVLLALPLLLLAGRHLARRRAEADAHYGGSPALRLGRSAGRDRLRSTLLLAAIALLAVAAARPQWGRAPSPVEQRGIDVAIVLDVSRSMTAADLSPSRAGAAARGLRDMIAHMQGNRVGLVTFAGSAIERSPLTLDLKALGTLIARAQIEAPLVQPGTDLRLAIETALNLLTVQDAAPTQAIVLVSDGEDLGAGLASAIRRARDKRVPVYAVFAGTPGNVALPPINDVTDVTNASREPLEAIARETGGQIRDVAATPGLAVEFRRMRTTQFASADRPAPIDRFPWFIGAALALLLAHASVPASGEARLLPLPRRGRTLGAAAVALLLVGCSGTLAYRQVEQGNRDYTARRYEPALAAYRAASRPDDPTVNYNIANALFQLRRYEEAAVAAASARAATRDGALSARLDFTAGNTAVLRGELDQARNAFEAVLRYDPDDMDAKANLELVLRRLAPPEPPPQQPQEQPGEGQATPEPGEQGQEPQPGQPQPAQPQPGQPQPGQADAGQQGQTDPGGDGAPFEGTAADVRAALDAALAQLGPEVTVEEARRILALAERANDLNLLPPRDRGFGVPPR